MLFANLCSYSQKGEKKFSFAIVENVLPFADFDYESTTNSFDNSKLLFNYIPSFEVGFDNTYFASLRFKALMMDEGVNEQDVFTMTATGHATFIREHSGYSTSIILGYNFTNRSQAHRFRSGTCEDGICCFADANRRLLPMGSRIGVQILSSRHKLSLWIWSELRDFIRKGL